MDLNQLAVFVRVVDKGSFTQAAKMLRQPKSRVSRNVATLEKELGVPLLYRSTRQLSLTEAGTALYERVKDHIYGLENSTDSLSVDPTHVGGLLRLTAAEDMGSMLLGPFVEELTDKYPDLRVELHLSNEIVDLVKEGMDIAIRIGTLDDTSLLAKKVGSISFILVAAPGYLKKTKAIKTVSDLSGHSTLSFSPEAEENSWTLIGDKKPQTVKIEPLCRSNNPKTLLDLALASKGIALLPEFFCLELIQQKRLVRVLPTFSSTSAPVHFVWPAQKGKNPKLRACLDVGVSFLSRYFR